MKSVNALLPANGQLPVMPAQTTAPIRAVDLPPEVKRQTEQLINRMFEEMRTIFTAWKQAWPTQALYLVAKATWTQTMLEEGITDWAQVERALRAWRAEGVEFVPSPGKFFARCWPTPEELGAPGTEAAYWEAQRNSHPSMAGHERWSHRAVFHAANACSRHSLLTLPADVSRLKFEKAYQAVIQRIARGEDLPEPAPLLPADVKRKGDPGKAREALAALRAAVSGVAV
ncbi:phage replication protein P [Halopseudomonas xinjiangensis]|uniref:Phage replication protein P n=1 Tax=Halopseudomonas xinjiangensis TaxID=487184 RepID=A0A1H1QA86_9GAMM|nr:replication protein P [Halopseudomonas xinjiangensis]SDS20197.1 phage replication protein P [Halopseudomonas xinjiangensis]